MASLQVMRPTNFSYYLSNSSKYKELNSCFFSSKELGSQVQGKGILKLRLRGSVTRKMVNGVFCKLQDGDDQPSNSSSKFLLLCLFQLINYLLSFFVLVTGLKWIGYMQMSNWLFMLVWNMNDDELILATDRNLLRIKIIMIALLLFVQYNSFPYLFGCTVII